ncbi:MAG: 50S ribosomal protein L29 [Bacteriovoracaceae bacterium]
MLNYNEVKNFDSKTIAKKVGELRTQLFSVKLQKVTTGLEKNADIKSIKKDIARLLTVLNSKK